MGAQARVRLSGAGAGGLPLAWVGPSERAGEGHPALASSRLGPMRRLGRGRGETAARRSASRLRGSRLRHCGSAIDASALAPRRAAVGVPGLAARA